MRPRLSPRIAVSLGLAAASLFVALVSGRVELVFFGLPFLVGLVVAIATERRPALGLTHRLARDRLFEDEPVPVAVDSRARTAVPIFRILDPLPAAGEVTDGANACLLSLPEGEPGSLSYAVRFRRRGTYPVGEACVEVEGWSRLVSWVDRLAPSGEAVVYPRVEPLRRPIFPFRTGAHVGNYPSRVVGDGIEFANTRPFVPGDRIRRINWRVSLRSGTLQINEFAQERNSDVVLMLDTLASVGNSHRNTLDLCVRAAAAFAHLYLRRKDRVGLILYGGQLSWMQPELGMRQFSRLQDELRDARIWFSYVWRDPTLIPRRILPPHALIVALSPLLDDRFARALRDLAGRGFDVVLLALSAGEVLRPLFDASPVDALACRVWNLDRTAMLDTLRQNGVPVIPWHPDRPLASIVAAFTRRWPRARAIRR